ASARMIERAGAEVCQRRNRSRRNEAVDQRRNAHMPRGEARAEKRGKLAPAKRSSNAQSIAENGGMTGAPAFGDDLLAPKPPSRTPGAAPAKPPPAAAEQTRGGPAGCRSVADAHPPQHYEIGGFWNRLVTSRHGIEEFSLVHGRSFGEVR